MLSYPIRTAGCPIVNIGRFEPQVKYKEGSRRPKGEWDLVPGGWKISHSTSEKQAMAPRHNGQVHGCLPEVDPLGASSLARGK